LTDIHSLTPTNGTKVNFHHAVGQHIYLRHHPRHRVTHSPQHWHYTIPRSLNGSLTNAAAMSFLSRSSCYALAASFALLYTSVYSLPRDSQQTLPYYDYGIDRSKIIKRQSSTPYVTTGIQTGSGPNGSTPLRLEVRELELDPTSWTLYILGLDILQYTSQTEILSWYQIAGLCHSICYHSVAEKQLRNSWPSIYPLR
jgi:hypothetical protein